MSQVIEILTSLGINGTLFYQMGIFFVAYVGMNFIVFKPYLEAYKERQNRTVGGQEEATQILEEVGRQETRFQEEAKKLNSEIRTVFGEFSGKAKKETEEILNEAKKEAEDQVQAARKELDISVQAARSEMDQLIPEISQNIETKFTRH